MFHRAQSWSAAAVLSLALGGAVAATGACAQPVQSQIQPAQSASAPQDEVARGYRLFIADGCYQCHGTVGQGGVGPRLAPNPMPAEAIALYIRNPANVMPPYVKKVLGDPDVRAIHAYLASIKPPPSLQTIPLLAR